MNNEKIVSEINILVKNYFENKSCEFIPGETKIPLVCTSIWVSRS